MRVGVHNLHRWRGRNWPRYLRSVVLDVLEMKTWVVWKKQFDWGLYIRSYEAQGCNPSYFLFKRIDLVTAQELVMDGLATDLYGQLGR